MNIFYDIATAADDLRGYMVKSMQEVSDTPYFGSLIVDSTTVNFFDNPRCLRMSREAEGGAEEVTVRIPGILCSKTLPPIERPINATSRNHVRKLRQYVKITGLGCDLFEELPAKLEDVHIRFQEAALSQGGRESNSIKPTFSPYDSHSTLDMHARYMTERRAAPHLPHSPFATDVDPYHILDALRGANFIHGPDNSVQYLRKTYDDDNVAQ
ncbi:hypothetical protein MD484_g8605, partial [Candolleomyces efflorescens]